MRLRFWKPKQPTIQETLNKLPLTLSYQGLRYRLRILRNMHGMFYCYYRSSDENNILTCCNEDLGLALRRLADVVDRGIQNKLVIDKSEPMAHN